MKSWSKRAASLGALTAAVASGLVLGAPAAHAAQTDARAASARPAAAGAMAPAVNPVSVTHTLTTAPYYTVTCTLTASTPLRYYGGAYPGGGVEAIASVQCNYGGSTLYVEDALVKNNSIVSTSPVKTCYSASLCGQTTDIPHAPGTYLTAAVAGVTFQDGYYADVPEADSSTVYISS